MRSLSHVYPRYLASFTVLIGELHKLSSDSRYCFFIEVSLLFLNISWLLLYIYENVEFSFK